MIYAQLLFLIEEREIETIIHIIIIPLHQLIKHKGNKIKERIVITVQMAK